MIEHNLNDVLARWKGAKPRLKAFIAKVYSKRLTEAVTYAKQRYLMGGTTSDRLKVRTGALRASFGMQVTASADDITARLGYILAQPIGPGGGNPLVYAAIHEGWPNRRQSTTIRAKGGGYLTIPLDAAMTPAGVARGRARDFTDTFVARSRRGNLLIFQKVGNGEIVPLFLLRTEVTVPARPALYPTVDKFRPLIVDDLAKGAPAVIIGKAG